MYSVQRAVFSVQCAVCSQLWCEARGVGQPPGELSNTHSEGGAAVQCAGCVVQCALYTV